MRRFRYRKLLYRAARLHDGTVIGAYPMRKPAPRIIKRDHMQFDEDGVTSYGSTAGRELSDTRNETRMRFQDVIAVNLNTRRAIRELVVPALAELRAEIELLRADVRRLTATTPTQDGAGA